MLLLMCLLSISIPVDSKWDWPLKRVSFVPGDLILGAFFPIHETGGAIECGKMEDEGLYQLESLLFTVDKINQNSNLLPGVRLGVMAVDSCDSAYHTLEESVSFMKGFIARDNLHESERQFTCSSSSGPQYVNGSFDKVIGIIGGRSSSISIQLADLLRTFRVPQISYKSNALQLSNKNIYKYFFRTVPPLDHQVRAIMETLKSFGWTYISIVYSDSAYGSQGFDSFHQQSSNEFCYSTQQRVTVERFTEQDYDNVMARLLRKNATVIVIFGEQQLARNVMSAATRKGVFDRFVWLGSEAWGSREYVSQGNERVLEGAISVSYVTQPPIGFDDHFMNLTPSKADKINPWFYEYWEKMLQCRMEAFPETPYNQLYNRSCNDRERIPEKRYLHGMPSAQLVRDAAHVFAHALDNFQRGKCGGPFFCEELESIRGSDLRDYIQNVHFHDEYDNEFQFDQNGDALPRYNMINYQKVKGTEEYKWIPVGTYTESKDNEPILHLNMDTMIFKHDKRQFPESLCSEPCEKGEAKILVDKDVCCWYCLNCTEFEIVEKEKKCTECKLGFVPNENKTNCIEIPLYYISYSNSWSVSAIVFSVLGMILCAIVGVVFFIYWDTPIIKASGRDLSCFLLLGIALLFSITFAVVAKPSTRTCGAVRFFLGFYYTLCYAAIVTKTRRIALIFDQSIRNEIRKVRYTRPRSQFMIAAALLFVEGIINTIWLIHDPPDVSYQYPTREDNVLICKGSDSIRYLVGLIYPFILMGFCTVYAFKTRKCPEGFNEARMITFTNFSTCIIWLAFLPTFNLNSSTTVRTITLSSLFILSGFVQLMCLFIPKAYIAVFQPEKNTRENVMCYYQQTGSTDTPVKILNVVN